jgi:predicted acylesterase/phospholipase RssA
MSERRVLFCRSGGGLPGIDIHIGIWLALAASGVHATHVHGTSAGGIISALDAAEWSPQAAEDLVMRFRSEDVVDYRTLWRLRAAFLANICSGDAVLEVLTKHLPATWEAYQKPLAVWTTQAGTSRRINAFRPTIAHSPAEAVAMSSRIPAVFPPVKGVDGLFYVDGGMRHNLPLPADWQSYDEVWLLIASGAPSDTEPAGTTLGNLLRVFRHLMADQILDVLDEVQGAPNVRVVWPRLKTPSMLEFDHGLIDKAFVEAVMQIQTPQPFPIDTPDTP